MNKPKDVAPDPTTGTIGCAAILDAEDSTAKNTAEEAAANQNETVEKFSSPFDQLKRAEKGQVKLGGRALHDAREEVLLALASCRHSRSQLGKALHEYKEFFISEGGWMLAVQAIGEVLARDERTVRNMVADYERVAKLPGSVIAAAEERGLDLAERKNAPVIHAIEDELGDKATPTLPEAKRLLGKVLKMRKGHAAKDAPDKADRLRWAVRMKIRTGLSNVATEGKLPEILAALEETMYDEWGMTEPVTVTLNPRPSGLTVDGRKQVAA